MALKHDGLVQGVVHCGWTVQGEALFLVLPPPFFYRQGVVGLRSLV